MTHQYKTSKMTIRDFGDGLENLKDQLYDNVKIYDDVNKTVWMPPKTAEQVWDEEEQRIQNEYRTNEQIYRYKQQNAERDIHIERLRKTVENDFNKLAEDIEEIRDVIRQLGILLRSDRPTNEQLQKHKMLREAYEKYKMIEALVLGDQSNEK